MKSSGRFIAGLALASFAFSARSTLRLTIGLGPRALYR